MKRILAAIIILFVITGATALMLFLNGGSIFPQSNKQINNTGLSDGVNSPSADSQERRIYKYDELGIEFRYPSNLNVKEEFASERSRKNTKFIMSVRLYDSSVSVEGDESGLLRNTVAVFDNPENLPLRDWIDRNNPNENDAGELVKFGNFEGILFKINAMGNKAPGFYFKYKNSIFVIGGLKYDDTFIKIANSFKSI